jgi:hypothetical protein
MAYFHSVREGQVWTSKESNFFWNKKNYIILVTRYTTKHKTELNIFSKLYRYINLLMAAGYYTYHQA